MKANALKDFFPDVPFACLCLNLGGKATSSKHRDYQNLAFGVCAIGIFGDFDYYEGGQLVLYEPKVIIEARKGDVAFLPSATISHGNIRLAHDTDERYSLVMYTPGSNFRWLANGCRTVNSLSKQEYAQLLESGEQRWKQGLKLFPTLHELRGMAL